MTTIAWKDGVLAADTLYCTESGWRLFHARKVWRLRDGRLFAGVHSPAQINRLREWIIHGENATQPDIGDSIGILVAANGRTIRIFEGSGSFTVAAREPYAWGSGRIVALTAMRLGASAREAVRCAVQLDTGTGGRIHAVRIGAARRGAGNR